MDLLRFVEEENVRFSDSLKNSDHCKIVCQLQGLYDAAMSNTDVLEDDMAVYTMLPFAHCHFLFATASFMRGHLSEAFASTRAAIDGALIGAQLIHDRASQVAYTRREKPFDNFARYLGNLIREGKTLPHPLVPVLFSLHKKLSTFAAHADVGSFVHRVAISRDPLIVTVEYFQSSKNETERMIHANTLFHTFVMILDVFSDFLVIEQQTASKDWQDELHDLGRALEQRQKQLQAALQSERETLEA